MTASRPGTRVRFGGMQTPRGYLFELTGGCLCLDLANTLDNRPSEHPRELLPTYRDLLVWGVQARAVTAAEARALAAHAGRHPASAVGALRHAIAVREAIFDVFSAVARGRRVPAGALHLLNAAVARASVKRRLTMKGTRGTWRWDERAMPDFDRVLWPAAWSAAELLASADVDRVRQCAGSGCAWLVLDRSKSRSRRWCDMSICGNRAKARRHRVREKTRRRAPRR